MRAKEAFASSSHLDLKLPLGAVTRRAAWVLPALLVTAVLLWIPMLVGIGLSLSETSFKAGRLVMRVVWFANYSRAMQEDPIFWLSVGNSVIWTVAVVAFELIFGVILALLLHRETRTRRALRPLLLLPWAVPPVVAATLWRWMFDESYGIVNSILRDFRLPAVPWLSQPTAALTAVCIAQIWRVTPFVVLTVMAGLRAIPGDVLDASKVDGCTPITQFIHVTLPLLMPVLRITLILLSIWTFNSFDLPWIMTAGGPGYATTFLPVYLYVRGFRFWHLGYAGAIGVLMLLVLSVLLFTYLRWTRRTSTE